MKRKICAKLIAALITFSMLPVQAHASMADAPNDDSIEAVSVATEAMAPAQDAFYDGEVDEDPFYPAIEAEGAPEVSGDMAAKTASLIVGEAYDCEEDPRQDRSEVNANVEGDLINKSALAKFPNLSNEEEILNYLTDQYPPTRDQTTGGIHYGTCWAHAATALCEFYMVRHGIMDAYGGEGKDLDYSELQIAFLCYHDAPLPANGDTGDRVIYDRYAGKGKEYLNIGCNLSLAAQSLMRGNGFVREGVKTPDLAAYGHAGETLAGGLAEDVVGIGRDVSLKNEFVVNIRKNPEIVKEAIAINGAIGVTYYSDPQYLNHETNAYYNYVNTSLNHVVVAVGWDDSYPSSSFKNTPPGDGAWLIRNSHSTDTRWSEESYFWLSYYDTSIGEAAYVYEIADPQKGEAYDFQYNHDSQLHGVVPAGTCKSANVFEASAMDAETLHAVQIDASEWPLGECTVYIYKNLEDPKDPESGSLESMTRTALPLTGKFTVKLEDPVSLTRGETFAIVVESENPVDRECDKVWKLQVTLDTSIRKGESFSYSKERWVDLSMQSHGGTRGNLCIRALTNNNPNGGLPNAIPSLSMDKGKDSATFTWPAVTNAEGYGIWRSVGQEEYALIAVIPNDCSRTFIDTSLPIGRTSSYKVVPVRDGQHDFGAASPVRSIMPPEATGISLSDRKLSIYVGQAEMLSASILPADAEMTRIRWRSDNPSVAIVDEGGNVTAVGRGSCVVSAYTESGLKASCKVSVPSKYVYELENDGRYRYVANTANVRKLKDDGWSYKKAFRCVGKSNIPIYYVYDSKTKARRYTANRDYAASMKRKGYTVAVAFYQGEAAEIKVYELRRPGKIPAYCYTTSRSAAKEKKREGWDYIGVAWFADC